MDMLQKCLQAVQDSQRKIERKLDKSIEQTKGNSERIKALAKQAVYLLTEKRDTGDESSAKQYCIMGIPKAATQEDKKDGVRHIHPAGDGIHKSFSSEGRHHGNYYRTGDLEDELRSLSIKEQDEHVLQEPQELGARVLGNEQPDMDNFSRSGEDGQKGRWVRS